MALRFLLNRQRLLTCLLASLWGIATALGTGLPAHFDANLPMSAKLADADGDRVADEQDLCPNTPVGTVVNAYGCPQTQPVCDFTTSTITLTSQGGTGGGTVRYVLADSAGIVQQISSTPVFSGLSGSHTYMALAISYNGSLTGITVGQPLSLSTSLASCFSWSEALVLKVCVPVPPVDTDGDGVDDARDLCPRTPTGTSVNAYGCPMTLSTCTHTTSNLTLTSTGGSGNGRTWYVLADSVGTIQQVSAIPTFSGLSGSRTYMALAITHDGSATGLTPGQALSAVSGPCYDWSEALLVKVCIGQNDTDGDGVTDPLDRCPNTPAGTPVNAYGCPMTLSTCTYTTSNLTLTSTGGAGGGAIRYVLADSLGTILQVNMTPAFGGLSGSHTYMVLAVAYDGAVRGLVAGQPLSAVSAVCATWSEAMVIKVCVSAPSLCDYTVGDLINMNSVGGSQLVGTLTRYLLVDDSGTIVRIGTTPLLTSAGLSAGTYAAYALVYTDDQSLINLTVGSLLTTVRANCLALSAPLSIKLCANCVSRCIPITVRTVRR